MPALLKKLARNTVKVSATTQARSILIPTQLVIRLARYIEKPEEREELVAIVLVERRAARYIKYFLNCANGKPCSGNS